MLQLVHTHIGHTHIGHNMSLFDFTFGDAGDTTDPPVAPRVLETDVEQPQFDFAPPATQAANGHTPAATAAAGDKRAAPQEKPYEPTPIDTETGLRPTFDGDDSVEYVIRTDANGTKYGVMRFTTRRSEDLATAAIAAVKAKLDGENADTERRARAPFTAWPTADVPVIILIPESEYKSPPPGDSEEAPVPGVRSRWRMAVDWDAPNITDMGVFPLPYNVFAGCVLLPEHKVGYSTLLASLPLVNFPIYSSVVQLMVIRQGKPPIVTTYEVIRFLAAVKLFLIKFYEDDPVGDSNYAGTHGKKAAVERRRLRKKLTLKRARDATNNMCAKLYKICDNKYVAAALKDNPRPFYGALVAFTFAYIRIQEAFFIDVVFGKHAPTFGTKEHTWSQTVPSGVDPKIVAFINELSSQRLDAVSPVSRRYHAPDFEAAMIADANGVAEDRRVALTAVLLEKLKFLGGDNDGKDAVDDDNVDMDDAGSSSSAAPMSGNEQRKAHIESVRAALEPLRKKDRDRSVASGTMLEVDELMELHQLCVTPGFLVGDESS